ncbi:hypothetical protein FQN60_000123 [Etheostoma spectabile]|uniref:Reverse transcriptase/retrotransposon-derived protein RNase H-like domain-containing protein n=1 Tax=Etheostoma spectabile TaxID=54343 RepID=A0A5J5CBZ3_9PERO|nr:hypothetical protein FQN60_000123 [Etheostoma spectabile]
MAGSSRSMMKTSVPFCNVPEREKGSSTQKRLLSVPLSINAPLRDLLKETKEFTWDAQHEEAFQKIKEIITLEPGPVLAYFDPSKKFTLQVDVNKRGFGAVLSQDDRPIAYASKALTNCKVNNVQIEKELYAILFGCKRFHQGSDEQLNHAESKPTCSVAGTVLKLSSWYCNLTQEELITNGR